MKNRLSNKNNNYFNGSPTSRNTSTRTDPSEIEKPFHSAMDLRNGTCF